jgi:hypothetical protein
MNRSFPWIRLGLAMSALPAAAVSLAADDDLQLPRNGWVSWQILAVADAPAWCCYDRNGDAGSAPV